MCACGLLRPCWRRRAWGAVVGGGRALAGPCRKPGVGRCCGGWGFEERGRCCTCVTHAHTLLRHATSGYSKCTLGVCMHACRHALGRQAGSGGAFDVCVCVCRADLVRTAQHSTAARQVGTSAELHSSFPGWVASTLACCFVHLPGCGMPHAPCVRLPPLRSPWQVLVTIIPNRVWSPSVPRARHACTTRPWRTAVCSGSEQLHSSLSNRIGGRPCMALAGHNDGSISCLIACAVHD